MSATSDDVEVSSVSSADNANTEVDQLLAPLLVEKYIGSRLVAGKKLRVEGTKAQSTVLIS
jgi:hypothetical protein